MQVVKKRTLVLVNKLGLSHVDANPSEIGEYIFFLVTKRLVIRIIMRAAIY